MYTYMCVYIYIYIYVYIYIDINICMYIYIYTHINTYMRRLPLCGSSRKGGADLTRRHFAIHDMNHNKCITLYVYIYIYIYMCLRIM